MPIVIPAVAPLPPRNAPDDLFDLLQVQSMTPIGKGNTRWAYDIAGHPDKVLKVCVVPSNWSNWAEAIAFSFVADKSIVGEVFTWSRSGRFLVMERLDNVSSNEADTFQAPDWWTDRKVSSLGRSTDGQIKIRDYASLKIELGRPFRVP